MRTVNPPDIERPKKSGRCGEIIYGLDNNMAKQYHSTVQSIQASAIPNPPDSRPAIEPIFIGQSDGTVKSIIRVNETDGSSRYVSEQELDIYGRRKSKLETIIEMFPPGSICKIHMDDTVAYRTVIHGIEFSTIHLEPTLYIEFFNLEDIITMLVDTSLSQYPLIHRITIYEPGQIKSIDSSEVVEMSRELIKNEMLDIKRQIAALKDNLRQLNRLRNSRDLTSRLFSKIDRNYHALVQSLK